MSIEFGSVQNMLDSQNQPTREDLRNAAKELDKAFLKLLLKQAHENNKSNEADPAMENFVSGIFLDVMSEHIAEGPGVLREQIEKQLIEQQERAVGYVLSNENSEN